MRLIRQIMAAAFLIVFTVGAAQAAIRINGNQMVEAGASVSRADLARRTSGARGASTTPDRLIMAVGQGIIAQGQLPGAGGEDTVANFIGIGILADVNLMTTPNYCPVMQSGDVNQTNTVNSADIIYLVNFVFKGDVAPQPCASAGDINCSRSVTSADIIDLVNFVFKGQGLSCHVCDLFPTNWECP